MQQVFPDVFVVPANQQKGYGFSHFVKHPKGNILLPRLKATSLSDSYGDLEKEGGVRRVLISDRHFGGPECADAATHFGATLYASDIEAKAIEKNCPVDVVLPFEQQTIDGYVEAIPTPGHTPGQFSYLISIKGKRCLFTGDFIYRSSGSWTPGNRSRKKMQASFDRLRSLRFDYVIGCADYDAPDSYVAVRGSVDDVVDEMLAACSSP